ncbi:TPA: HNH endonuclease, partial [Haemophilus influenzae]
IDGWYNAVPRSNDKRFSSEFLRFLANFGFIEKEFELISSSTRNTTKFKYIPELDEQISVLINGSWTTERSDILQSVRQLDIENLVRQSANTRASARPKQQQFRKSLIENLERCVITGNMLTRVLQAAHIKPYAYGGSDDISNGLLLRADIHIMFDAGLINLRPDPFYKNRCFIELSDDDLVRRSYPSFVNEITIQLPKFTNMENIEWRYENRLLGVNT